MSALREIILRQIAASGPLSVAEYMELCLLHPEHGYYTTRPPFGAKGDFTTAPEISQIFGEVIAASLVQAWRDQSRPRDAVLVELGPGRATLMADLRRVWQRLEGEGPAIHLVEASPALREVQSARLGQVTHHEHVETLPEAPIFLVANEFFDALPIRQFQRGAEGWRERMIGVQGDGLGWGLGPVLSDQPAAPEGTLIERCPAARPIMAVIAARIARHGGAALLADYGGWMGRGDTFQALRHHAPVDPLAMPGEADLTAHVDFAPLADEAARAGLAVGYLPQGQVLEALGVRARAEALARAGDAGAVAACARLCDADQMGALFKMLGIWPANQPALAPFTAAFPSPDRKADAT